MIGTGAERLGERGAEGLPGQFRLFAGVAVYETNRLYLLYQYYKNLSIFRRLEPPVGVR